MININKEDQAKSPAGSAAGPPAGPSTGPSTSPSASPSDTAQTQVQASGVIPKTANTKLDSTESEQKSYAEIASQITKLGLNSSANQKIPKTWTSITLEQVNKNGEALQRIKIQCWQAYSVITKNLGLKPWEIDLIDVINEEIHIQLKNGIEVLKRFKNIQNLFPMGSTNLDSEKLLEDKFLKIKNQDKFREDSGINTKKVRKKYNLDLKQIQRNIEPSRG